MRVVHLSDIHLSSTNLEQLKDFFLEALLTDLRSFHDKQPIDLILISGDLVHKGGESLGSQPFEVFEQFFIKPLLESLRLTRAQLLFVAGNHDIDYTKVDRDNEYWLANNLNKDEANVIHKKYHDSFGRETSRVIGFKEFERKFHKDCTNYHYSNFESNAIYHADGLKVGIALINDSWRCSHALQKEQHFIGFNQLFHAKKYFHDNGTAFNVAVFHHPLEFINSGEAEEVENILRSNRFYLAIFGHSHRHKSQKVVSQDAGFLSITGRSTFNDPDDGTSLYQPGYQIIDLNLQQRSYEVQARKFVKQNGYRFEQDVDSLPKGTTRGTIGLENRLVKLNSDGEDSTDLPDGFKADVHRIVRLLIGKSLYPNKNSFVRELIQNAVDACSRRFEKTGGSGQIIVAINSEERSFEVYDEGDGMTKSVLRNQFAIVGKSISQEFNDSNGQFKLISQFGIGFISTFIVAQRVIISTRTSEDGLINFAIDDVFKGFDYNTQDISNRLVCLSSGTVVKVYLKPGFNANELLGVTKIYCRHISNLRIFHDDAEQRISDSWNIENTLHTFRHQTTKYELRLGIGQNTRSIIASNSGFLITPIANNLIPFRFPAHIGGEVDFLPGAIDLDLSRTTIIDSEKSREFKRELSTGLRKLFRDVLEDRESPLLPVVVNYLQCYLAIYDSHQSRFEDSYLDFFSKSELISLCGAWTIFSYNGKPTQFSAIVEALKQQKTGDIYFYQGDLTEFQKVLSGYLQAQGHLVIRQGQKQAPFHDGQQAFTQVGLLQALAGPFGLKVLDMKTAHGLNLLNISKKPSVIHSGFGLLLRSTQEEYKIQVEVIEFRKSLNAAVSFPPSYFLNFNHPSFNSILSLLDDSKGEIAKIYLLGLLGVPVKPGRDN